jgi:hypothetical protein
MTPRRAPHSACRGAESLADFLSDVARRPPSLPASRESERPRHRSRRHNPAHCPALGPQRAEVADNHAQNTVWATSSGGRVWVRSGCAGGSIGRKCAGEGENPDRTRPPGGFGWSGPLGSDGFLSAASKSSRDTVIVGLRSLSCVGRIVGLSDRDPCLWALSAMLCRAGTGSGGVAIAARTTAHPPSCTQIQGESQCVPPRACP